MQLTHQKICITKTTYKKACPYCKTRPLKLKTCGHFSCQYQHHILEMRKDRKTERKHPTRTVSTIAITIL